MEAILTEHSRLEAVDTQRQAAIGLAHQICTLESCGCTREALRAEHNAIKSVWERLWYAVLADASRAEVITIMDAAITFCSTQFAGEEDTMRKCDYDDLAGHVAEHKKLLTDIVDARRRASGEGLPLAVLEVSAILDAYHKHVNTCDLAFGQSLVSPLRSVDSLHSHGVLPMVGPRPPENIAGGSILD
jgi:hemerythrin